MGMKKELWFPYAQMRTMPEPLKVVSASGCRLKLADGRELIDAIASWWCVIHGYSHPELVQTLSEQAATLSHVMLGGLTHEPAEVLAEELVRITPAGLNHVFFSDSGSVGVEVALKMAVQFWQNRGRKSKTRILALEKAYHGDTTGAMAVCDPEEGMHSLFAPLLPKQAFLPAVCGGFGADEDALTEDLRLLENYLRENHTDTAAMIVEPLMQAAGGFHLYSPKYLKHAREMCEHYEVILIFDEVATGFGRTGKMFAADYAGVCPDIMVVGKGLTAGMTGHAATLATDRIFEAFLGTSSTSPFMHGPTFMANPLACAVALKSLQMLERDNLVGRVNEIESILKTELEPIRKCSVKGVVRDIRVLGAMGCVEVENEESLEGLQDFAAGRGVWLRPFGRYAYTMPPYRISDDELKTICTVLRDWFCTVSV